MELSQNMAEKIIVISSFLMGCSIIIHLGVSMAMESSQITTHDVGPIPATPGGATPPLATLPASGDPHGDEPGKVWGSRYSVCMYRWLNYGIDG